ncbi:MAG: cellulase family glycosylhydrolase [Armatimonadota bacterium]|nr:cellulase family glycosylhydrolase [Armatimonadota bacterium]
MRKVGALVVIFIWASIASSASHGLPNPVIPDCLGVNIHFTGREDSQVEQIAQAGFRFIRMDFHWHVVEKERGTYDFTAYDELVDSLAARGIRPLFILDYGNPLYDRGLAPRTEEARKAFANFAAAAARHFRGRGVIWEIWNEPNLAQFWRPDPNPEHYVKLAELVSRAVKSADPGCTILAPALSGWDVGFMKAVCERGLLKYVDAVSLHPYGCSIPEDAERYYSAMRQIIVQYKPADRDIPIVSGEWGYSSVGGFSVERQAQYLVRMFIVNLINDVRLSIWYDWRDDGPDPNEREHHFGTVYLDGRPKPAYVAMQTLARELAGYTFAARLPLGSDERDYLVLFKKGDDCRLAAWTTGEKHTVRLPVDVSDFELVSLLGERKRVKVSEGALSLELSGSVTYVVPLQRSRRWSLEAGWMVSAEVVWRKSKQILRLTSQSSVKSAKLTVSGPGVPGEFSQLESIPTPKMAGRIQVDIPYVWTDESPKIHIRLSAEGLTPPLERLLCLRTDNCLSADIMPPIGDGVVVLVSVPPSACASRAKLILREAEGVEFTLLEIPLKLTPGKQELVSLPFMTQPKGAFGFAFEIRSDKGGELLRVSKKRCVIVETFDGGSPGEAVENYACELDGDPSVPAYASLSYASCSDLSLTRCVELRYSFDKGWRFVRISPKLPIRIDGKPALAKIWVKGDGVGCFARLRFVDSQHQTFQPDLGRIDFRGWRCLSAPMTGSQAGFWGGPADGIVHYPISWTDVFLLDNVGGRKTSGMVFLGPLMLVYD